ncbi:hypothetical protein K437DRAFT_266635 [Tilletiaria anomala UBC 951]|uniref:DNA mismatch repair proteins mutS family domain-containing protein n=1 Tax=Tilletiaria anomala (strain ATCC 24038 / CBS 436.72 / UBC 951) TaxID=1037660 RepID=A0A066WN88_TILAU|nr:uncharacterized protein K437DRAFT_266635 [Tilletiaria anomala UBC 951]KDN52449.1 hypothetical protein K437DRAFT_266635 [Tilletiaria anomala UBC 951]
MSDEESLSDAAPLAKRTRFNVAASIRSDAPANPSWQDRTEYDDFDTAEAELEEEEKIAEGVIMSILIQHGRVGCAIFEDVSHTLFLLEDAAVEAHTSTFKADTVILGRSDVQEGPDAGHTAGNASTSAAANKETGMRDLVGLIIDQHKPDMILASSKCSSEDIEAMKTDLTETGGTLQVRPAREYDPVAGKMRLLSIGALDADRAADSQDDDEGYSASPKITSAAEAGELPFFTKRLKLASAVDAEQMTLTTAAACALLSHVFRLVSHGALPNAEPGLSHIISGVETMCLSNYLQVTSATQKALSIFVEESVASAQSSSKKEGLSLFNVLDFTVSPMGRTLLRRWLAWPSAVKKTINVRHDAVGCLLRPQTAADLVLLVAELKGGANIASLLGSAFARGTPSLAAWRKLSEYCRHAIAISEILGNFENLSKMLSDILSAINVASLADIADMLGIIDWQESTQERSVVICVGHDAQLDEWRRSYAALPSLLSTVAESLRGTAMQEHAESFNICFFPQLGYLIALPRESEDMTGAERQIEGLTFSFSSNMMDYFKSQEMEDLDVHLGDLHSYIADRQIEITNDLQQRVLAKQAVILSGAQAMAELDCLISLARAAQEYGYVRPNMIEGNEIRIERGRHPLSERCVESFVPNDAMLVGGKGDLQDAMVQDSNFEEFDQQQAGESTDAAAGNSMIVVTGANCCGKSVFIKSIAMIVYMAQCGSFVPADRAVLGVCDKILTSIQVLESVGRMQSNFLIDISQCSFALRHCTARSLVLLDETAKGTDAKDGAALFAAIVQDLLTRGQDCPKAAVATHFHDVFFNGILPPYLPFTPMHMQIVLEQTDGNEDIIYLFKAAPGFSDSSNAGHCARIFGIDVEVVNRGDFVTRLLRQGHASDLAFAGLEDDGEGAAYSSACITNKEELMVIERVARLFLDWDIDGTLQELEDGKNEGSEHRPLIREQVRAILASQLLKTDRPEHMEERNNMASSKQEGIADMRPAYADGFENLAHGFAGSDCHKYIPEEVEFLDAP